MTRQRTGLTYLLLATMCTGFGFFLGRTEYIDSIALHAPGMLRKRLVQVSVSTNESAKFHNPAVNVQRQVPAQTADKPKRVCNVYDIGAPTYDKHECLTTKWTPAFHICIHPVNKDIYVSKSIKRQGIWEKDILGVFQSLLEKDPEFGVIDIGANIGVYALLAATMGRPVVAVEARLLHVEMIHHAIQLGNLHTESDFTLLHNAVSDNHNELKLLLTDSANQGKTQIVEKGNGTGIPASEVHSVPAILMDDIAEVVHFRKAIIKMDIEGSEHRAISHCEKLLKEVFVPYIFMEWVFHRKQPKQRDLIMTILARNGYSAFNLKRSPLQTPSAHKWPGEIIWKHVNATF